MIRIVFALAFGVLFAWMAFSRPEEAEEPERKGPRYRPYLYGWLLPSYAAAMLMVVLVCSSWLPHLAKEAAAWIVMMFLHISLYFVLLSLALPLLRRYLRAGSCALLWLTPNYLYLAMNSGMMTPPRWVISLPQGLVESLVAVWLAGALAVLGWKMFAHLRFRRWLLRGAEEVSDPDVLAVWQAEVDRAREKKPKFRLVTSPQASTPITIGLFPKSVRVVLPQRHYTPEELKLIFRHELVHIGREDAWNKFFVAFCIAMCWFNPLMWIAMRRSSEDLELSCDETVLSGLEEGERRQYADLILRTAGDGRGFTTCLSASASALRYRLRSIVKPGKKVSGALLVGVAFVLLFVTYGQISLAYGVGTGESAIFYGRAQDVTLRQVRREEDDTFQEVLACRDEGALGDYLASLSLSEMTGDCSDFYGKEGEQIVLLYDAPEDTLTVMLWDDYIKVVPFWEGGLSAYYYHVSGGLDWGKVHGWLEEAG